MTGWSEEEILADLLEAAKPPPKPELKSAEQKLEERCASKPDEAVYDTATRGNDAAIERLETMEGRRQRRIAKELADYEAEGSGWHSLVQWRQSVERAQERLRALDGEIPERGVYSPIARFEREMRGR